MYQKIMVGQKELTFCSCASVNVCYNNIFHEDFIRLISTDEGLATNAMMKMAFVMAEFGRLNDRKQVNRLNEDNYCDWLDQFTTGELVAALPDIQAFYMSSTQTAVSAKKNSAEPTVR